VPKYLVTLEEMVPHYVEAEVVVEAADEAAALTRAKELADKDEVEWSEPEADWDESKLVETRVEEA
jgi:hypothetical protein